MKKKLWGGHLWSRGKFFRSVGAVTSEKVEYHIKESQTGGVFSKTGQTSNEIIEAKEYRDRSGSAGELSTKLISQTKAIENDDLRTKVIEKIQEVGKNCRRICGY